MDNTQDQGAEVGHPITNRLMAEQAASEAPAADQAPAPKKAAAKKPAAKKAPAKKPAKK